ncbi:M20 aminoacylase family protein [Sutterella sp.]|uniref:M20 aminoacylase family protein n=1 Tax=Sutterella sp. TaxID=1981025 RepID=UPI0026DF7540|nr:M20 aminoacylase family protein [Sutterella sp.]MDO5532064.1 M20 aminoacylase family protein [Sutterella sp.]
MSVLEEISARSEELAEWRHDFHRHPELGLEEVRTAGVVAEKLRGWGVEVTEQVGITGVVGVIRGSLGPGKTIGFRADMDALAMTEKGTCPWKSVNDGVMHGCGHDGHTTMLLGAARYLAEHRDFRGTVIVIFQPAEEGNGGALAMLKDDLFGRFPMDEIYGMHNWTGQEPGCFRGRHGAAMAGSDFFTIRVKGKGAHGSAPQLSADTALAAAMIVTSLQQIVARNVAPLDSAVVSVTKIHTGSAFNIIPQEAELGGCTRFFSESTGAMLRDRIAAVAKAVAESVGCSAETEFDSIYGVLDNDDELTDAMMDAARAVVGDDKVGYAPEPQMASEDFSFLRRHVRGAYGFLGGQAPHGATNLHNPGYDFDDRVLPIGAAIWVTLAQQRLG